MAGVGAFIRLLATGEEAQQRVPDEIKMEQGEMDHRESQLPAKPPFRVICLGVFKACITLYTTLCVTFLTVVANSENVNHVLVTYNYNKDL